VPPFSPTSPAHPPAPDPSLKSRVRLIAARVLASTGLARVLAPGPACASVLLYHSVAPAEIGAWIDQRNTLDADVFERQAAALAESGRVVGLDDLLRRLERGESVSNLVVITFDDGYLDNLTVAAPILDRLKLPATLYLPTGHLDRTEEQWVDRLHSMVRTATSAITDADDPRRAYGAWCARLIVADLEERERLLADAAAKLRPDLSSRPRTVMTWDEVRSLRDRFPRFGLGVHTADHLDMSSLNADAARAQIRSCIARFAGELGVAPKHFSFPYGRSTPETRDAVRAAGLASACASSPRHWIAPGTDRYWIHRHVAVASSTAFGLYSSPATGRAVERIVGLP
jgi:peptidoglycan/xylan/chitin deacetylase (PgdA/CDA1 family)